MKYVAFFRGINVGKKNLIKMADLKDFFIELGFKNPKTYLRSGNVIFESENKDKKSIAKDIENNLKVNFDISVPILVKNTDEIAKIIEDNPFQTSEELEKELYITLLFNKPDKNLLNQLNNEFKDFKNNKANYFKNNKESNFKKSKENNFPNNKENKKNRDEFIIKDMVVYLLCRSKYNQTKFNNNYFESKLKEIATTRNWKTMNKLAK